MTGGRWRGLRRGTRPTSARPAPWLALAALAACALGACPRAAARPSPAGVAAEHGPWRVAPAPLLTRWAADVSPEHALPEYPRPQLVRHRWQSLNGLWEFAPAAAPAEGDSAPPPFGRALPGRILVPYPVESALSGVGRHYDRVWYRRTFVVPEEWGGERVLLHFGAVDWEATVYLNGRRLTVHRGGYDGFSLDVTEALLPGAAARQELVVGVYDPTDRGEQPRGKQVERPRGIWYTAVTGIWQTVWLEPAPVARVHRLSMTPDVAGRALRLTVAVAGAQAGDTVEATALDGDHVVGRVAGVPGAELRVPVPRARLWSPDDPFLYDLQVALRRDGEVVDSVASYFGMRSVSLGGDGRGGARVLLNGRPFFGVGPLDQGWWPDGLYTAPTDDALRSDLEITRRLGFTMTRKHAKVEPERWYYWADRLGLAVWQDMPSGRNGTAAARRQFEAELWLMIEQRGNHPSIVAWVPFNEGWGQFGTRRIADYVKELDPSRLVDDASGWRHENAGDVVDVHRYQGPQALSRAGRRATVVGEFGGLGMAVPGHTWAPKDSSWGYDGTFRSADSLAERYGLLMGRLWRDHATHGTSAGVYTQLTDVEREVNGLLTYDRAVLKIDTARVVAATRGLRPLILPEHREFVRRPPLVTVSSTAADVRYTTDGGEPTATSRRYRGPFVLRDADTVIVRARAFADGEPVAPETSAWFRRVAGREPDSLAAAAELTPGVRFAFFRDSSLRALTMVARRAAGPDTIAPLREGTLEGLTLPSEAARERFVVRYGAWLRVPRDGVYSLGALADDGVRVWVGDRLVLDGMGYSPAAAESRGDVALRAGLHPVTITWFQAFGPLTLRINVEGPGMGRRAIDGMLYRAREQP